MAFLIYFYIEVPPLPNGGHYPSAKTLPGGRTDNPPVPLLFGEEAGWRQSWQSMTLLGQGTPSLLLKFLVLIFYQTSLPTRSSPINFSYIPLFIPLILLLLLRAV